MIILRSALFNVFFFGGTCILTLAGDGRAVCRPASYRWTLRLPGRGCCCGPRG